MAIYALMRVKWNRKLLATLLVTIAVLIVLIFGPIEIVFHVSGYHPKIVTVDPVDAMKSSCVGHQQFLRRQVINMDEVDMDYLETQFGNRSLPGGHFSPITCRSSSRIAIIMPYRDRKSHLLKYLNNVIPKLLRQQVDFTFFVIEQANGANFNRGMVRNIGFVEAMGMADYDCFIFNDVDTLIEDDRNIFYCNPDRVRHLVSGLDRDSYRMPYSTLAGGIIGFTPQQFIKVNGYSNLFFLWGAEDDDVYRRVIYAGMMLERPPNPIGVITTLSHRSDPKKPERFKLLDTVHRYHHKDGLNNVKSYYKRLNVEKRKLFTWVFVDIDEELIKKEWSKELM